MTDFHVTRVQTIDSHASPGEPRKLFFEHQWLDVERITDRWYEGSMDPARPLVLYYKVLSEGRFFLLRYLSYFQRWQVAAVDQGDTQ